MRYVIEWTDDLQRVLDEIEKKLALSPMRRNLDLAAKAFLTLLKEGKNPTADEIVEYVHKEYAPKGGWIGFDRAKWRGYPRRLAPHLQSSNPEKILSL